MDSKPLKLSKKGLKELFEKISENTNETNGMFEFKNVRVYVKYSRPKTSSERYKKLYEKRRNEGICIQCSRKVEINPKTGKPYRYCSEHRLKENTLKKQKRHKQKSFNQ
jgi:hypothetical protein